MHYIQKDYLSWDFDQETTHSYTNNFHKYPAMMVPRVVEELLKEYHVPNGLFLDPFCGTGRSLLAARVAGMRCVGIDVNPLAVLIAHVKLFLIDPSYLEIKLKEIIKSINHAKRGSEDNLPIPNFFNRDYWFAETISADIARLMIAINEVFKKNSEIKDFYYVVLSETIRDVSWTRKSEFKLYRMEEATKNRFNPDVNMLFISKAKRNIEGMRKYKEACKYKGDFKIMQGDSRYFCDDTRINRILNQGVDTIITSPPYGDSRTTVDYGNFSRLSLQWFQGDKRFAKRWKFAREEDIATINARCLGGTIKKGNSMVPSETLQEYINKISAIDANRARKVFQYYGDLYLCFKNCINILSQEGYLCFVVANRNVKGYEIPMNNILLDFARHDNINHIRTIERNITGKKLPRRINTNSKHIKQSNTMVKEYVLIFKK